MRGTERFEPVQQALAGVKAEVDAAQSHGMLCGMLSAPEPLKPAEWIAEVLRDTQPTGTAARACLEELSELYADTGKQMQDLNFDFQLLLPSDESPLSARAEALANWCDGFLYGLGLRALKPDQELPREVREALRDMGEIAHIEMEPEADEENERAFSELVEYVRVAALLVMESLQPKRQASVKPTGGSRLH